MPFLVCCEYVLLRGNIEMEKILDFPIYKMIPKLKFCLHFMQRCAFKIKKHGSNKNIKILEIEGLS